MISRREALLRIGSGFGAVALASQPRLWARATGMASAKSAGTRKAKRVLFLFLNGGVSQVDTFDPKPLLSKHDGEPLPGELLKTERRTGRLMRSPFEIQRFGQSGIELTELFPELGRHVDEMCFLRSMTTRVPNHEPSLLMMNTGHPQAGRPSMGSWLTYGLGTECDQLPGFVVLSPGQIVDAGPPLWSSAFLPALHQGTYVSSRAPRRSQDFDKHEVLPYLKAAEGKAGDPRSRHDLTRVLNRIHAQRRNTPAPYLDSELEVMETAFRMQTEAPEVFDLPDDAAEARAYGPGSFARGCRTAIRLLDRGVRVVQLYSHRESVWDAHEDIHQYRNLARLHDRPMAALLNDLHQRGLMEDTLVVCATEFGRTPVRETGGGDASGRVKAGRDHNPYGFTVWLAGAGVRGGTVVGATDDFGFRAIERPLEVHDLHATILHLLGIDHRQLTYAYSGRDFRLTDVGGKVIEEALA